MQCFSKELGSHGEKLTEKKVPSVTLIKGANTLQKQGNTGHQYSE